MPEPIYKINDPIDCDAISGHVREVFESTSNPGNYAYAIEAAESEAVYIYSEEELD